MLLFFSLISSHLRRPRRRGRRNALRPAVGRLRHLSGFRLTAMGGILLATPFLVLGATSANPAIVVVLLAAFALLYISEPWFSNRFAWYKYFYFPAQTVIVSVFCYLEPFLDMKTVVFVPVFIQLFRTFSGRTLVFLTTVYLALIGGVILPNLGVLEGAAFILLGVAVCAFFISYDSLYARTQADQAESQQLLTELQAAQKLTCS